jgi:hypothetical protein
MMRLFQCQPAQPSKPIFDIRIPYSFFEYFSVNASIENRNQSRDQLTCSLSFDFLRCDGKERDDFDHGIHHHVPHRIGRRDIRVNFQSFKVVLDPDENTDECFLASTDVFGRLEELGVKMWPWQGDSKGQTERRTPTPAKDDLC